MIVILHDQEGKQAALYDLSTSAASELAKGGTWQVGLDSAMPTLSVSDYEAMHSAATLQVVEIYERAGRYFARPKHLIKHLAPEFLPNQLEFLESVLGIGIEEIGFMRKSRNRRAMMEALPPKANVSQLSLDDLGDSEIGKF